MFHCTSARIMICQMQSLHLSKLSIVKHQHHGLSSGHQKIRLLGFLLNLNLKMSPSLQITRDPRIPRFYSCTECTFYTLGNPWGPIVSIPTTSTKSRNQTKVYFLKEIEFCSDTLMWYQYNFQYK